MGDRGRRDRLRRSHTHRFNEGIKRSPGSEPAVGLWVIYGSTPVDHLLLYTSVRSDWISDFCKQNLPPPTGLSRSFSTLATIRRHIVRPTAHPPSRQIGKRHARNMHHSRTSSMARLTGTLTMSTPVRTHCGGALGGSLPTIDARLDSSGGTGPNHFRMRDSSRLRDRLTGS